MQKEYITRMTSIAFICLFLSASVTKAENFRDLNYPRAYAKKTESFLDKSWTSWDNLKYRADPNDASGASDTPVSKIGYKGTDGKWKGEIWDMAFLKRFYEQGQFTGWNFVGYANNDNGNSNLYPEYFGGWLNGYIPFLNENVLPISRMGQNVR